MQIILQELASSLASEAAEQETEENQAVLMDEADELERAKLPEYTARFKVSMCAVQILSSSNSDKEQSLSVQNNYLFNLKCTKPQLQ